MAMIKKVPVDRTLVSFPGSPFGLEVGENSHCSTLSSVASTSPPALDLGLHSSGAQGTGLVALVINVLEDTARK